VSHKYTPKQIKFLGKNIEGCSCADLTKRFNRHFKLSITQKAIRNICLYHGLQFDPRYFGAHQYTPAEIRFIKKMVTGRSYAELTALFNAKFGFNFNVKRISSTIKRLGLSNGRDTRFHSGQVSHNKGKKGYYSPGSEKGWFKPGHPGYKINEMPVGGEHIDAYGYVQIKYSDNPGSAKHRWKGKHVIIWEKINGKVPKGHVVIFADRNRRNFKVDNLLLVARKELVRMNQMKLITTNKKLTEAGLKIARVKNLIGERVRESIKTSRRKKIIFIDRAGSKVYVICDATTKKWVSVREKKSGIQKLWAKDLKPRSTFELAEKDLRTYAIKRGWQIA
jgi:3,4-dihydroxy-2-butanone 4-phosphate synthase